MQQACTLVSYSCQTKPAISILRLHLNVASFLVISFYEVVFLCISKTVLHVFSSGEDDARQKLPSPPFLAIFAISYCSMFAKQLLLFLPNPPSSLLSFVLPMMKLSKSIHYMEYELMIKNL